MREILAEAWPSETLGLGGIFRIVSGKVNTIQLYQIKIKIIRQSSTLCPTSLLVQSILMQRSTNGWRWFSDNLFLVSTSFLKYAVLWDGRPPQCPLCLCLKVLPVEFLRERIKRSIIQLIFFSGIPDLTFEWSTAMGGERTARLASCLLVQWNKYLISKEEVIDLIWVWLQGGHYHYDTTPDDVEYLGYYNTAEVNLVKLSKI